MARREWVVRGKEHMTYEESLEIAMEQLYDAIIDLRYNNKGYHAHIESQCNRLLTARNVLCKALEEAEEPKREWVGLTKEEVQHLCAQSYHTDNAGETHFNRGSFADAIEAKLKEKNT